MNRKFKKCLITGVTGSGGSYLCEAILKKDKKIKIFGTYRSEKKLKSLKKILGKGKHKRVKFKKINLKKKRQLINYLTKIKPDLIFNLAFNAVFKKGVILTPGISTGY